MLSLIQNFRQTLLPLMRGLSENLIIMLVYIFLVCFKQDFEHLTKLQKSIREAPGLNKGDIKTKIVYTINDLQLLSRTRTGRWAPVPVDLATLPPIQSDAQNITSSPPQGRNRSIPITNQKRLANSPLQSDAKQAREESSDEVVLVSENRSPPLITDSNKTVDAALVSLSTGQTSEPLNLSTLT